MTARTDFSVLQSAEIAKRMGVPSTTQYDCRLTKCERVAAESQCSVMKHPRSLDERNAYMRSGSAWMVPMEDKATSLGHAVAMWFGVVVILALVVAIQIGAL